jgi:hypothetical protein
MRRRRDLPAPWRQEPAVRQDRLAFALDVDVTVPRRSTKIQARTRRLGKERGAPGQGDQAAGQERTRA